MKLKRIVSAVLAGVLAVTTAVSGLTLSAGAVSEKVTGSAGAFGVWFVAEIWNKNSNSYNSSPSDHGDYEGLIEIGKNEYVFIAGLDENDIITITAKFDGKEEQLQMMGWVTSVNANDLGFTYKSGTSVKEILDTEQCTLEELSGIRFCDPDYVLNGVDEFEYEISITPSSSSSSSSTPTAPTTLKSAPLTPTSTKLTWKSTADSFNIYRATSKSGTYKKIGTSESASYTDKGLTKGKTYYYKVTAVSGGEESEFSKIVSAKACAPAPKSVKAAKSADGKAKLTWKKASGAEGYEIFMAESSGGKFSKIKTVTKGTTIGVTKSGLTSGKTYYFKVRSFITVNGKKVYSGYSKTVKVKV